MKRLCLILPILGGRYSVARANKEVTKGKDGIELLESNSYVDEKTGREGHYTRKIYHLDGYLPGWIKLILPSSATKLYEESWDTFPTARTVLTSSFLGERFTFTIESCNVEDDDGQLENAVGLSEEVLKQRVIHHIDIGNDAIENSKDYLESEDPSLFQSKLHDFGPLKDDWKSSVIKTMCCYKVVTVKCSIFGFQTKGENYIMNMEKNIFTRYHKQLYCWLDEWFGFSFEEILSREALLYEELEDELELDDEAEGQEAKDRKKKKNSPEANSKDKEKVPQ